MSRHDLPRQDRNDGICPVRCAAPDNHLAVELTETLRLAVPMALTQLGQIAMMTTDLALVGRLGDQAVAAAALASTVYFVSFTVGMGLVSAVSPLAAQAFGARDPRMVRRALRVGLWAALLVALPMMAFPLKGEAILLALGQAPVNAQLAQQYLFGLVWGIAPALWFIAIRGFMGAVNRPEPILWITLAAIPANGVLVYVLIHGAWGLPRLGTVRRRARHRHRQYRLVPGGAVVRDPPPAVQKIPRARPHLAHRLEPDAKARHRRRADLDLVPAGIWPVRRRRRCLMG